MKLTTPTSLPELKERSQDYFERFRSNNSTFACSPAARLPALHASVTCIDVLGFDTSPFFPHSSSQVRGKRGRRQQGEPEGRRWWWWW